MKNPRRRTAGLRIIALWFVAVLSAESCMICLSSRIRPPSFAEQIIQADQLILARADGSGAFIVEARLRGQEPELGSKVTLKDGALARRVLLAFQQDLSEPINLGPYSPDLLPFLRIVLPLKTIEPTTASEWATQLETFRESLGHRDPRIAHSAWTAWALAPYAVLRKQRPLPDRATLLRWLDDPIRSDEASLYWPLLGLQADAPSHDRIHQAILSAWKGNESKHLAALLDAKLSAKGSEAIAIIQTHYLEDSERTLDEIQCALIALRMHGNVGDPELHELIASTFEAFAQNRRPLAGLVAEDLQRWERWHMRELYIEILNSDEPILPSTRKRIIAFIQSPITSSSPKLSKGN